MAKIELRGKQLTFSPVGFESFYLLIHNRFLPSHAREWVSDIFAAYNEGKGIVIEAFRGSTKTTTVTQTFAAFYIGHFPHTANLLIQVGDDIAQDNAAQIADLIENNPAWQVFFPSVVPDRPRGWGAAGYEVMRSDMDYEEWRRLNAARKDPTFIGLGRTSRGIIGKHPDGLVVIDDIDDENTTSSDRERSKTRKILTGTIFPASNHARLVIGIGTPWVENDTISYMKSTGEFNTVKTPVMDENPTWPEKFDEKEIQRQRNLAGSIEFARMFMLDLEQAKGHTLRREWLHDYPSDKIDPTWPAVMGIDYASTEDKLRDRDRDYFALAVGRLIPGGGVVLVDGFRDHVSQGEAIQKVQQWAIIHPTLILTAIEKEGIGGQFFDAMTHQTGLYIHPASTADKILPYAASARNKGDRFQKHMAVAFETNRAWISNQDTPFLKIFRDEWISWPIGEHDDTLDAVFYMLYAAVRMGAIKPQVVPMADRDWTIPRKKQENPWKAFCKRS